MEHFGGKTIGIYDMLKKINEEKQTRVKIKSKIKFRYYGPGVNSSNYMSFKLDEPFLNETSQDFPILLELEESKFDKFQFQPDH